MDTGYLSQQVTTIIERLHGFFDEIGVPSHERDSRESELFSVLSETLHNQLNLVAKEKHDLTEEAQRLIKTIRQMERSLDDTRPDDDVDDVRDGLDVTFPLLDCLKTLKEKHRTIAKLHRERYEQVKKLAEALESYASHLEPTFVEIPLPPTSPDAKLSPTFDLSPTYVAALDVQFTRVYDEYNKRITIVSNTANEIINLWSELGTPQAQIDSQIVQFAHESPEQLGLHKEDLKALSQKRDKLLNEKQQRERRVKELRTTVEGLWDRLSVDERERKQFLAANRGCGLRTINEFEDELSRLNELKRQNLHIFVEEARYRLQELWDMMYFSEEEMLEFAPAFSDVYTDALLEAHEREICRLEALKEQRAPILAAVERHRSLIRDRDELEASARDGSRLMAKGSKGEKRDPGKLLREEKMRKRIAKDLPKVEAELRKTLEAWEDEYGRPFCVHGERYLEELEASSAKAPPPRSKTPNALSGQDDPKSTNRPRANNPGAGTKQSSSATNSIRGKPGHIGGPPLRSKTPSVTSDRNAPTPASTTAPFAKSVGPGITSPSKLPTAGGRAPMGTLRDGHNSPERRPGHVRSQTALNGQTKVEASFNSSTLGRSVMGPPRAPPPKMKDLFENAAPVSSDNAGNLDRPTSVLRHHLPDDPYYDPSRPIQAFQSSAMGPPARPAYLRNGPSQDSYTSSSYNPSLSRTDYPVAPPSRAPSNTSSVVSHNSQVSHTNSATSGSENWETYTDNSDHDEADAAEAYYARIEAQQARMRDHYSGYREGSTKAGTKRPSPQPMRLEAQKRLQVVNGEADGSDANWTDDGDIGDTY